MPLTIPELNVLANEIHKYERQVGELTEERDNYKAAFEQRSAQFDRFLEKTRNNVAMIQAFIDEHPAQAKGMCRSIVEFVDEQRFPQRPED